MEPVDPGLRLPLRAVPEARARRDHLRPAARPVRSMAPTLTSPSAKPRAITGPRRSVVAPAPAAIALGVAQIADAYLSLKTLATYSGLSLRRLRGYLTDRAWP